MEMQTGSRDRLPLTDADPDPVSLSLDNRLPLTTSIAFRLIRKSLLGKETQRSTSHLLLLLMISACDLLHLRGA